MGASPSVSSISGTSSSSVSLSFGSVKNPYIPYTSSPSDRPSSSVSHILGSVVRFTSFILSSPSASKSTVESPTFGSNLYLRTSSSSFNPSPSESGFVGSSIHVAVRLCKSCRHGYIHLRCSFCISLIFPFFSSLTPIGLYIHFIWLLLFTSMYIAISSRSVSPSSSVSFSNASVTKPR